MKLREVIIKLEELFPSAFAYEKDNCGLQIGNVDSEIKRILLALECTHEVLEYAIDNKINLIITHHPLIYFKLSSITSGSTKGKIILDAINNNISVFSIHTNADSIRDGLNDYLANLLNLTPLKPIEYMENVEFVKLVTFIPKTHIENVRARLLDSGIGKTGNYSHCSFNIEGLGTFLPHEGSKPFIGEEGKLSSVEEIRFETILFRKDIGRTINILKSVHPYEEVAYDLYPVLNDDGKPGIGRYCKLEKSLTLAEFIDLIPKRLNINSIRYNGDLGKSILKVALCTGSGGNLIYKLSGVDLLVTGDLNYHEAMEALEKDIAFIDIGHYQEKVFIPYMAEKLKTKEFELIEYDNTTDPFKIKIFKDPKENSK